MGEQLLHSIFETGQWGRVAGSRLEVLIPFLPFSPISRPLWCVTGMARQRFHSSNRE